MIIDVEFHEFCLMFPNADQQDFDGLVEDSGGRQKLDRGISYERVLKWS